MKPKALGGNLFEVEVPIFLGHKFIGKETITFKLIKRKIDKEYFNDFLESNYGVGTTYSIVRWRRDGGYIDIPDECMSSGGLKATTFRLTTEIEKRTEL